MSEEPQVTGDQNSEAAAPAYSDSTESQGHESPESQQVPLDALQAERGKRQYAEDELKMMRDNMQLMMAQQQQLAAPKQVDEFEGVSKDDVITYGDLEKIISKKDRQYQANIQELRMSQKYPDYQEIVTTYLPEVLKTNPGLRNTLEQSNDYELAYHLAKNSDSYRGNHKQAKKNVDAERIVQNANRTGSLSSAGQTSPISQAKRWKEMSDSEFMAASNKNLGSC